MGSAHPADERPDETAVELAEAVKDALNGTTFNPAFTAVRMYRPKYDAGEMEILRVAVVPRGQTIDQSTRMKDVFQYVVDVALIQQFADPNDLAKIDPLVRLADAIIRFLARHELVSFPVAKWTATGNTPLYNPELLDEQSIFMSVVRVTYVLWKTPILIALPPPG